MAKTKTPKPEGFGALFSYLHEHIQAINNSKIFAGLMIITLNIVSKFANIKLSKTLESYFKYTFSRQILVFAIAWMGTRDIYIALFITLIFIVVTEYLLNEDSAFHVMPESFKNHHLTLLEEDGEKVSDEDVAKAKDVLKKAAAQNKNVEEFTSYSIK
jgi:hypothetical protein